MKLINLRKFIFLANVNGVMIEDDLILFGLINVFPCLLLISLPNLAVLFKEHHCFFFISTMTHYGNVSPLWGQKNQDLLM